MFVKQTEARHRAGGNYALVFSFSPRGLAVLRCRAGAERGVGAARAEGVGGAAGANPPDLEGAQ